MKTFLPANILIPNVDNMNAWAVIACDQFTSEPAYWDKVKKDVGDSYSTLHLVLPEIELKNDYKNKVKDINQTMEEYLNKNVFKEYKDCYIYVERTLINKKIRKGIVGMIDLTQYDYHEGSSTDIRTSEKTVIERIPPRKEIRKDASIELPHVLLLCDDDKMQLLDSVEKKKDTLEKIYDFDLMENGGHITGYLLQGQDVIDFQKQLEIYDNGASERYKDLDGDPILYAVGDGNHSLATAKACYEDIKKNLSEEEALLHPARYALVELENIHDDSQQFEPIHRIINHVDVDKIIKEFNEKCGCEDGNPIHWISNGNTEIVYVDATKGQMPIAILQAFLDDYLKDNEGEIDYIHGEDSLVSLSKNKDSVGFLLPPMEKGDLFKGIVADGVLPRKTFSMGHATEKRYYLEARKIK